MHDALGRTGRHHLALGHHDDRITEHFDELHVVFDHAKCIAALDVEAFDCIGNGIKQRAVHTRTHLIQKHDFGVNHHGATKLEELFLATRDIARFLVGDMRNGQEFQNLVGLLAQGSFLGGDGLAFEPRIPKRLARLVRRNHHQVLAHRHGGKFMRNLEGTQNAFVEQLVGFEPRDILTTEQDVS